MWFAGQSDWLPTAGLPLLAASCVALIAAVHVWVVKLVAPLWLRLSALAGIIVVLISFQAPELMLFALGHLLGVLTVRLVAFGWQNCEPVLSTSQGRREALGFAVALAVETVYVLSRSEILFPGRWFAMGGGVGLAAAIIDLGITAQRRWLPLALVTGSLAVALACVTAGVVGRGDLLGRNFIRGDDYWAEANRWFYFGVLASGTMIYGLWRFAGRLVFARRSVSSGYGRILRLLAVWPVLIGLSLFIFSPWIEAWWRLPPAGTALPQRVADPGYGRLIAMADQLDWSMVPDEPLSRMPPEVLRLFGEANLETLLELPKILDQPCRPPLDSLRIASQLSQRESDSFESIVQALFLLEQGAVATHDVQTQYVVAHIALLLARPLRRESLYSHYALGCWIELQGFAMIDRGRQAFDVEQCRALMASVRESAVLEEPCDSVLARDDEWLMDVFGWRTRIKRACYSWVGSPAAYVREIELEHEGFRRTLLCDLALRQYECEHQLASPSRLDDLVPRYLSEVPRDPFGAGPLQYESSRAILPFPYAFSLGPNQRSEGGEVSGFMREGDDLAIARYSRDAACDELLISRPPRATDHLRRPPSTASGLE